MSIHLIAFEPRSEHNETMQNAIESGQAEGWKEQLDKLAAVVAGLVQAK